MMEQLPLFQTSWAVNEGFKDLQEKLNELVPFQGKVPQGRSKNKKLEKFRVAQNLIHDLFNNGLMNRRSHFTQFFDMSVYTRGGISQHQFDNFNIKLEPILTQIMQEAAIEQGI
tara:strand:- start:9235 stop:9576 length:342 start_codon:yes stop_codon:yes gene_type:complete